MSMSPIEVKKMLSARVGKVNGVWLGTETVALIYQALNLANNGESADKEIFELDRKIREAQEREES